MNEQSSTASSTKLTGAPARCVRCGSPLKTPIGCFDCHTLFSPRSELNHFERLGLVKSYAVDVNDLERRYLAWSRELHPDYFQLRPAEDQQLSLSLSAALNDAYSVLKDPFRRAEYLLQLYGGPSASEQRAMPEGFLENILELRMEIDEAKESGAGNAAQLRQLEDRLQNERDGAMKRVADLFTTAEKAGMGTPSSESLLEIRRQLNTVKYLDGLLRELTA
jgi:molecular chaperone HscB